MSRRQYTPRAFAPLAMDHMANVERCALWAKPGMGKTVFGVASARASAGIPDFRCWMAIAIPQMFAGRRVPVVAWKRWHTRAGTWAAIGWPI